MQGAKGRQVLLCPIYPEKGHMKGHIHQKAVHTLLGKLIHKRGICFWDNLCARVKDQSRCDSRPIKENPLIKPGDLNLFRAGKYGSTSTLW